MVVMNHAVWLSLFASGALAVVAWLAGRAGQSAPTRPLAVPSSRRVRRNR